MTRGYEDEPVMANARFSVHYHWNGKRILISRGQCQPIGLWSAWVTAILSHKLENQPKGLKHIRQSLHQAEALTGDCLSQNAYKAMYTGTEYLIRQRSPHSSLRWECPLHGEGGTVLTIQNKKMKGRRNLNESNIGYFGTNSRKF